MAKLWSRISSAVVLLDADAPDFPEAALAVEEFFRLRGIPMQMKAVHRSSLVLAGRRAELFISLLPGRHLQADLCARISQAVFKAGRRQLRGEVYDLVVSSPEGSDYGQKEVFARMTQLMDQIS